MGNKASRQTAAQKVFSNYTQYISKLVIDKYGPSYTTQQDIRNRWRNLIPYSIGIEDFLIFQTKMYIRFLDSRDPNSTNPQFLESLVKLMADYLSAYTMQKENHMTRKKAKELLKAELYDNCSYIKNLIARQTAAREIKNSAHNNTYKRPTSRKQKQINENAKREFGKVKVYSTIKIVEIKIKNR